jgi:hypothetical protein
VSLVRRFIRAPTVEYKPKKAGETDPVVKPILDRGMRCIAECARAGSRTYFALNTVGPFVVAVA